MKDNKKHFVGTGHTSGRRLEDRTKQLNPEILASLICVHDKYCNIKLTLDKLHCSKNYAKNCQTAKYYTRYGGEQANQMGVGS